MVDRPQCAAGHFLKQKKPSLAGRWNSRSCRACGDEISTDAVRLACPECKNYHVCMKCADPSEGSVAVGDGPYILRVYVPPGRKAGDTITVATPDGQSIDVDLPQGTAPGAGFDVYYSLSNVVVANPELAKPPRVLGYRWFCTLTCILLQICLSPTGYVRWLPADSVELHTPYAWLVFLALGALFTLTTVPVDRKGISWLRILSALAQGFGYGYLISFDRSTVLVRMVFAIALGVANAFDRLEAIEGLVATMPVEPREGAQGTLQTDGSVERVEVVSLTDTKATVRYVYKPASKSDTEVVDLQDVRLKLDVPPRAAHEKLMKWTKGGFQLRPWGFALGVTFSQWAIQGVSLGDFFSLKDLAIILSTPLQACILWVMVQRSKSNIVFIVCLALFIGTCCFEFIHFLPQVVNLSFLAIFQLYAHHVVAYLAIPVDVAIVFWFLDPSTDDIATWVLCRAARKIVKASKKPLGIDGRPEDHVEDEMKRLLAP